MATAPESTAPQDQTSLPATSWDEARVEGRVGAILCLIPAFYLAGVVGFALFHPQDFIGDLPQGVRYVVAPLLILAALLWAAFRVAPRRRFYVGSVASGLLVALFLFEAHLELRYIQIIRAMVGSEIRPAASRDPLGLPPGRTSKQLSTHMGVTRLSDAVLGGTPGSMVDLCRAGHEQIRYRADQFGFRNPPEASAQMSPRILLLGDSFVEGICLPEGQDIAGRVRAHEDKVLSFGTRGAGPLLELAILGRFGPVVRPNWSVVVFYEGNDWENLEKELGRPWLVQALRRDADFGSPTLSDETIDAVRAQIARWDQSGPVDTMEVMKRGHVARNFLALHQSWTRLGLGYPKSAPDIPQYAAVLAQARSVASQWGGRVAMAYLPQSTRFMGLLPNGFAYDGLRRKVLRAAEEAGVPVIDMTPHFAAATDPMALYGENHLSPAGAELVARKISAGLRIIDGGAAK